MNRLRIYINRFLGLFPSPLPVGVTAFEAFVDSIKSTYDMPTQDSDSIKFAIAARILRFGESRAWASKYGFVVALNATCAKQIAGNAFQEIKNNQKRQQLAEEEKQKAEVTATPVADVTQTH